MNAQIVPLTDEETREFLDEIAKGYRTGELKAQKLTREQRRELTKHIIKESK